MTTDRHNRYAAIFFITIGILGTLPAFYPIVFALSALAGPNILSILGGMLMLSGLAFGYALFFGYVRYLRGTEKHPVRLWKATLAYNLALTVGACVVVLFNGMDTFLLPGWPLFLSIIASSAVTRERWLHKCADVDRIARGI